MYTVQSWLESQVTFAFSSVCQSGLCYFYEFLACQPTACVRKFFRLCSSLYCLYRPQIQSGWALEVLGRAMLWINPVTAWMVCPTRQGFSRTLPRLVEPSLHQNLVLQLPCSMVSSPERASIVPLQCYGHLPTLLKAISLITWSISIGKIDVGLLLRLWVLLNPCSQTPLAQICYLPVKVLLGWGRRTGHSHFSGISTTVKLQWEQN